MGAFLSYSIISGLLMLAMYLAYRLFLARENQHGFNRAILLLIYLISFTASPVFLSVENLKGMSGPQASVLVGMEVVNAATPTIVRPTWGTILIWIFIAGMIVVTLRTIITWIRLTDVIRYGEKITRDGYTLVVTDNERFAPFSWMHYIVISRADYDNNYSAITTHELKHVACRHWLDLLIAQAVCIINWFNPAAWLMRDELILIHEYQADMAVIDSGHDAQEYQILLIKKAVGARFPSLANSLNHSKLKKRITMMYKEQNGAGRKFKALALVPMLALALGVAGVPAVRAAMSTISSSEISESKSSENPSEDKTQVRVFKVTNINNDGNATHVTVMAKGLGNALTVNGGTFTTGGKTYNENGMTCNMTNGEATIIATFPVSGEYKKPKMTLIINGEVIPFDLENFQKTAQSVVVGDATANGSNSVIVINGKSSSVPGNMVFYLDGKQISEAEMKALAPDAIASVEVDTQNKIIKIKSKK
ncbi:MAG: M56 family metallopeptidase [Muribaculaceae bacterium]|nr:M56 family metallopeptidase [Muribaculaceae bacterium]